MPSIARAQLAAAVERLTTAPNIAIILVLTPIVWALGLAVYRLTFHPLARFPGPKHYAASPFPFAYHNMLKGEFGTRTRDLHRKYGPVVRVAPDRLIVDGAVGWQDVYMHKPGKNLPEFGKSARFFGKDAEKSLIAAPTREAHRRQRRQLAHGFSEAAMHEQEPLITYYVDLFIRRLSENSKGGRALDMLQWLNYLTFDIIGDLALGESFGSLESSDYHPWVNNLFRGILGSNILRFFVECRLSAFALLDPGGYIKQNATNRQYAYTKASARMELGVEPVMRNNGAIGPDGKPKMQVRRDFITYMMRNTRDGKDGLNKDEICVNANTLIAAGSDTTGTNLSTLLFQLSRPVNRRYFNAVAGEIRSLFKSEADITLRSVQSNGLPLLHACIEESLRMHPPVAEMPARISPGGLVGGKYVAPGTKITIFQNATYQNPDNFLEPEKWQPERFLNEGHPMYDPRFKAHDNFAIFKPFSAGPRDCIGKNLAYAEMRLVAARVLLRFDLELDPSTKSTWLEDQRIVVIWHKSPLFIRLKERTDLELKNN
ncbi:hypothetical protein RB595_003503 [Gaeumannomyces hyphopodioides]